MIASLKSRGTRVGPSGDRFPSEAATLNPGRVLKLLSAAAAIFAALAGLILLQDAVAQRSEDRRATRAREIETERAHAATLLMYIDRLTELAGSDRSAQSASDEGPSMVLQALTRTVLRQLDGSRNGIVVRSSPKPSSQRLFSPT